MTDLLPRYYELLTEAHGTSEMVDRHDLDADDVASVRRHMALEVASDAAQAALLLFISSHLTELWTTFKHVGVGK